MINIHLDKTFVESNTMIYHSNQLSRNMIHMYFKYDLYSRNSLYAVYAFINISLIILFITHLKIEIIEIYVL